MKVHFLKENSLEALRTNLSGNLNNYRQPTNQWILDYFGEDENPFGEYKYKFPDFQLEFNDQESLGELDVSNTIALYSAMKSLSDTQASDERLWSGLCHCDFWEFLHSRWKWGENKKPKDTDIKSRYFFAHTKRRSLFTNSLSKLWWLGRLTYDETRADPFELTRYFDNDYATKVLIIFSNNYMSNNQISLGLISALKKLEEEGFVPKGGSKRELYYKATEYLNILGGSYILDYFSAEEIEEKVLKHMKSGKYF